MQQTAAGRCENWVFSCRLEGGGGEEDKESEEDARAEGKWEIDWAHREHLVIMMLHPL